LPVQLRAVCWSGVRRLGADGSVLLASSQDPPRVESVFR